MLFEIVNMGDAKSFPYWFLMAISSGAFAPLDVIWHAGKPSPRDIFVLKCGLLAGL